MLGILAFGQAFAFAGAELAESPNQAQSTKPAVHLSRENSLTEKNGATIVIEEPAGIPDETDLIEPSEDQLSDVTSRKSRPRWSGTVASQSQHVRELGQDSCW